MSAQDPIDLTEEPIASLSVVPIQSGANVFLDLCAVIKGGNLIDHLDWQSFLNKMDRTTSNVIFLSTQPINFKTKRELHALGLIQPVFFVKNKSMVVNTLKNSPTVFIDTYIDDVEKMRKDNPDVDSYWVMPEPKRTVWNALSEFIDLF